MFGKIIQFKKQSTKDVQYDDLPSEITNQFSEETLKRGLRLAESSRISHINFGRESYFGLVTEPDGKGFNVHVSLNPESKTLTRASCACFRSFTRSYCHHIASFVRYILRPDPDTGRLRSLEEDYQDSFWRELSWYGYRSFGDSVLGFRCQADHGGEGIRIAYYDRDQREILVFMPGARLAEEFLYEFFDLIRRDIDSALFRRMFGRKLKDPNVPSLRRRPWLYSESEESINRRGFKSVRQHLEESMWHKIAKVGFLLCGGRGRGGGTSFRFLEHKQELIVEALDENAKVVLRLTPPRAHIGVIIEIGEKKNIIGGDLLIHKRTLATGYRVTLADTSELVIDPIVENPDSDAHAAERYLLRTELEKLLFGPYYYFPEWGFFRIAVHSSGLPPEYFSPQKQTVIPADRVTAFLDEYAEMLQSEPGILMDESLVSRETIEMYDRMILEHRSLDNEGISLGLRYHFGEESVLVQEIYEARRSRKRFVIHGDKWIDVTGPHFAWIDGLKYPPTGDSLRLSLSEYLRLLALNDQVEKRFTSVRLRQWFESLEHMKPPTRLPSVRAMKGKLRGYQKNGLAWLWFLYENHLSGLLCDDMGLGKTHQIMALMTAIVQKRRGEQSKTRFLVICPTTVLSHWKDKVMEYCPFLDPDVYHGTDRSFEESFEEHSLIITSYGIALRDMERLAQYHFDLIVLDEVQAVKNKATKTYAAVSSLNATCTIGLTGTPVENSLTDLKALFDIILPAYLMTDSLFESHFRYPIEERFERAAKERLTRLIHPFILRRTKEQVLTELPAKFEDIRRCSLSQDQLRFYRDVVENRGSELIQTLRDSTKKIPYMHIFAVLNYLKQICNHPALLEGDTHGYARYQSGKWDLFVELLEESLGSGQKVVVFSQYVKMLELIESFLNDRGIRFATIKGHTRKRAEAVKRFNTDPRCMVFTASLRASGLGIDLTAASVVIHYDRWWNSAREEQATDRVHRIGQRRGVQVFKLITEHTLEEKIDSLIAKKRALMESVIREDDKALVKHFSREDLIELMTF